MNTPTLVPEIKVGEWSFGGSEDNPNAEPALFYDDHEIVWGVTSTDLRKAALDLMKLAGAVAAAGW
jgi:hypothetical protein